jgi:hypothetical protein
MSWNIELACLRGARSLSDVVPDVFAETKQRLGFEDATSSTRGPDLCVARVGAWTVAIDVDCRLSGNAEFLAETSADGELYVVRVAMDPSEALYRAGKKAKLPKAATAELRAMAWLRERTGIDFGKDLWKAKYTLFTLDA